MLLVTGGAGYIGSHFVKTYLAENPGQEVLVIDNLSEGYKEAVSYSDKIHFVQQDIGDPDTITRLCQQYDIDGVVHFAASCYVGESQTQPAKYFHNNVINSLKLFEGLQNAGVKRVVFSSTCATYGNPQYMPLDEAHPQKPINIYGLTKLMIEQALEGYADTMGWSVMRLRYFNAAGADESGLIGERHDPETHLIPLIFQAALGQRPAIDVFGDDYDTPDGTCIRDYIHVNDLATAHCKALSFLKENTGCYAVNLGTTHGTSVKEMIETCASVIGKEIPIRMAPRRPGDPPRLVANADKALSLLGWKTEYDLKRIIETAWAWEQQPQYSHSHQPC